MDKIENNPAISWSLGFTFLVAIPFVMIWFGNFDLIDKSFPIFSLFSGYICLVYAPKKNRNKWLWAILGVAVPILFWVIYYLPPSRDNVW